jgi:2,6-dihydroxypseudooxynicotine hydrolase
MISLSGPHTINEVIDEMPPMTKLAFQVRTHSPDLETAKRKLTSMDLTGVTEYVTCPSFIITGANDRIIPADQTRRMAEGVRGPVHLQIIENANHVATNKAYMYRPLMADWMADQLRAQPASP